MNVVSKVHTAKDIVEMVFPNTPYLIHPVLRPGGDWLIAGDADSFKSLFLMQLFIHASLGLDYLWFKIDRPLRILYINADDNLRIMQDRLNSLNTTGLPLDDNFMLISQPYIMFNQAGCDVVQNWVINHNPDLVVFDHLTGFVPGGTVDHIGMQQYVMLKNWICSQDVGVAALAHTLRESKDNKDYDKLRKIAGIGLIKAGHGSITYHEMLERSVSQRGERFQMTLLRQKSLKKQELLKYDTTILVDELPNEKTLLKEI